jgi:hypothetical protein
LVRFGIGTSSWSPILQPATRTARPYRSEHTEDPPTGTDGLLPSQCGFATLSRSPWLDVEDCRTRGCLDGRLEAAGVKAADCLRLPAQAHLGDTLEQSIARYGATTGTTTNIDGDKTADFLKDGVIIGTIYLHGNVAHEVFMKTDSSEFSATELKALFDAESDTNNSWSESNSTNQLKTWYRTDRAFASYMIPFHILTLQTHEYSSLHKSY